MWGSHETCMCVCVRECTCTLARDTPTGVCPALEWHTGIKYLFLCVVLGACLQSLWECLCKPVLVLE